MQRGGFHLNLLGVDYFLFASWLLILMTVRQISHPCMAELFKTSRSKMNDSNHLWYHISVVTLKRINALPAKIDVITRFLYNLTV